MEAFRVFFTPNRKNGAAVEFNVSVARTATVLELLMKSLQHTGLFHKEDEEYGLCLSPNDKNILSPKDLVTSVPAV